MTGTARGAGWRHRLGRVLPLAVIVMSTVLLAQAGTAHQGMTASSPPLGSSRCQAGPQDVLPPAPTPITRVVAGSEPVVDSRGAPWSPTGGLSGGSTVNLGATVGGTASPQLYASMRVGVTSYEQQVPGPGTYAVDLFLADTAETAPGARVFDVLANGQKVVDHADVVAAAGPDQAHHLLFTVPVAGRCLELTFRPDAGRPIVSAIEVGYLGPSQAESQVWSDEFDGPAGAPVDPRNWQHETGEGGWGNHELEAYTADPANSHLDGAGHLAVVARRRGESADPAADRYTSARLITLGKVSFEYGRISIDAQLPVGQGLWPGFWALGDDIETVGYPDSGEIDIMEGNGQPGVLLGNLHGPDTQNEVSTMGKGINSVPTGRFSRYSMLWTPIGISLSAEGHDYFVGVPADLASTATWSFDKPYYLLVNLAVGGTLPGPPDGTTPFPAQLLVDDVRASTWGVPLPPPPAKGG